MVLPVAGAFKRWNFAQVRYKWIANGAFRERRYLLDRWRTGEVNGLLGFMVGTFKEDEVMCHAQASQRVMCWAHASLTWNSDHMPSTCTNPWGHLLNWTETSLRGYNGTSWKFQDLPGKIYTNASGIVTIVSGVKYNLPYKQLWVTTRSAMLYRIDCWVINVHGWT